MKNLFDDFITDESGAVTADWVVLTASVVVLVLTMIASLGNMNEDLANQIATSIGAGDTGSIANYDN